MSKISHKPGHRTKWVNATPEGPFTPADLANLEGWYDVTDAANTVVTSGKVTNLKDKSPHGRHMNNKSGPNFPVYFATGGANNLPYMAVTGSNNEDILSAGISTIAQPFTCYLVLKQTGFASGKYFLSLDNGNTAFAQHNVISAGNAITMHAGATFGKLANGVNNNWQFLCMGWNGTDSRFSVNNEPYRIGGYNPGSPGGSGLSQIGFQPYYKNADFLVHELIIVSEIPDSVTDDKIRNYLTTKYTIIANPFMIFYGDSITTGASASDGNALGFATLVSQEEGFDWVNFGYPGSVAVATVSHAGMPGFNFEDVYNQVFNVDISSCRVFIGYGTNDQSPDSAWKATFKAKIQEIIDKGVPVGRIILGGPPYHSAGETAAQPYIEAIASELGVVFFDAQDYMSTRGGSSLMNVDGIHPNDDGHRVYADGIKELL